MTSNVEVNVEYCGSCGYVKKFQELSDHFHQKAPHVSLKGYEGRSASFEVKVNEVLVHSKLSTLAFPDYDDLVNIIQDAEFGNEIRTPCKQQPITSCCLS